MQDSANRRKYLNFSSADYRIIRNVFVKLAVPVEHTVSIHDARPNQYAAQPLLTMIVCSNKVKLVEKVTYTRCLCLLKNIYGSTGNV